jgi:hypothetical protein
MSDNFTPEIFEQKDVAERECQRLQKLLDEQMPNYSFIFAPEDDEIIILDNLYHEKLKRQREEVVIHEDDDENDDNVDDNDDDNEDDNDELKIKPHTFKRHEDDNDEDEDDNVGELLDNELLQAFDSQTWGMEPQSPWSQHTEASQQYQEFTQQNTLFVPLSSEPIPNLYTPQGVGLFFYFVIYFIFFK